MVRFSTLSGGCFGAGGVRAGKRLGDSCKEGLDVVAGLGTCLNKNTT